MTFALQDDSIKIKMWIKTASTINLKSTALYTAPKMAMVERLNTDKLDTTLYESQSVSGKIENGYITLSRDGIETIGVITDGTTVVDL
ncbi:MAG: hypothetical protein SPI15_10290 [Candidatus Faecousia sp.]|uniref:hypothetical protein n=1 Tax=Flintibacter porci TaxID=3342383 RepID=UPI002A9009ED|nr:hypothetical protein [Clostridiales bacterium]MCI6936326.1 hypothetical protein [Clostridiales bacterium]MCI7019350.1 hypothetical protein [Clostridiales bacterium]MDY3652661.1 hypothetical protein [Dysosmobacter sp.]MDY6181225.1 hypothetical protein [Candidatus Faecousia sp.]